MCDAWKLLLHDACLKFNKLAINKLNRKVDIAHLSFFDWDSISYNLLKENLHVKNIIFMHGTKPGKELETNEFKLMAGKPINMKRLFALIFLFVILTSHELFLKLDSYFLSEYETSELYLYNGTFDESENIITRDRIINAQVLGPDYEFYLQESDYYDKNNVTYLKLTTGKTGTYVAGISTLPREIELNASEFKEYLEHEGLWSTIEDRKRKGISDQPVLEKYSKHVKTIFQVDNKRTRDYATELGHPIEFMPISNPYELSVGDIMSFKLLYKNAPLSNQVVHISVRTIPEVINADEKETMTDANGEFSFKLNESGKWYVATIHMQVCEEKNIDYESNWATLTFEVK